jgi:hypothetical protein
MQDQKPQQRRTDGIAREAERREITGVPQSTWRVMQDKGLAPKPVDPGAPKLNAVQAAAWKAYERSRVHLFQRRLGPERYEYLAVKAK